MVIFDHEKLEVYRVAVEYADAADSIASKLKRGNAHIRDQLRRASDRSPTTLLKVPVNSTLLRKRASIASRCARAPRARLRSIHARGGSSVTSRHWNMPESSSSAWSRCSLDSSTLPCSATPEIGTGTGTGTGTGF